MYPNFTFTKDSNVTLANSKLIGSAMSDQNCLECWPQHHRAVVSKRPLLSTQSQRFVCFAFVMFAFLFSNVFVCCFAACLLFATMIMVVALPGSTTWMYRLHARRHTNLASDSLVQTQNSGCQHHLWISDRTLLARCKVLRTNGGLCKYINSNSHSRCVRAQTICSSTENFQSFYTTDLREIMTDNTSKHKLSNKISCQTTARC